MHRVNRFVTGTWHFRYICQCHYSNHITKRQTVLSLLYIAANLLINASKNEQFAINSLSTV